MKLAQIRSCFSIFKALIARDMSVHNTQLFRRTFDAIIWSSCIIAVAQYIFPLFGMTASFGSFMLVANVGLWGLFEINTQLAEFLVELEGNQTISYFLTLPIPSSFIFAKYALGYAYRSWLTSLAILPVGLLVLPDFQHLNFTFLNIAGFLLMHLLGNIFYGFFCLFTVSLSPNATYITTIRSRIIFPLWNLGCANFTWHMLYQVSPLLAYINLFNPMIYILEGIRNPMLSEFIPLPYWICVSNTLIFTLLFGYLGIKRLKKRLDCL